MYLKHFRDYIRLDKQQTFDLILVSAFWGYYYLLFIILLNGRQGIFEREEWLIFKWGWSTIPAASVLTALALEKIRKTYFKNCVLFYPRLHLINSLLFFALTWFMRLYNPVLMCENLPCVVNMFHAQTFIFRAESAFLRTWIPARLFMYLCTLPLLVNLIFLFTQRRFSKKAITEEEYNRRASKIYFFFPLIVSLGLINFTNFKLSYGMAGLFAMLLAGLARFHKKVIFFTMKRKALIFLNISAVLLILFSVFDPNFFHERQAANLYLGPVIDLISGKSILVDVPSLYGVYIIYFLKSLFTFIPLTYQGLSLIGMLLYFLQYVMLYILLRAVLKSPLFSLWSLFFIVIFNFWAHLDLEATAYPSSGPLRYGLPIFLLFVILLRSHSQKTRKFYLTIEYLLVAIASIWSFETFIYVITTYLAVVIFGCFAETNHWKRFLAGLFNRGLFTLLAIAAAHFLFALNVYCRSGQLPRWERYLDGVMNYVNRGLTSLPIDPWSPWLFVVSGSFLALITIIYFCLTRNFNDLIESKIIVGMTVLSIIQFNSYLNRSHPANLYNTSIPVFFVASYWLVNAAKSSQKQFKWFRPSFLYCIYFFMFYFLLRLAPFVYQKILIRWPQYVHIRENFTKSRASPQTPEALYLINKYAPQAKRIAIFLDQDANVETFIISGKTHVLPYDYAHQANDSALAKKTVLDSVKFLKEGDIIFVTQEKLDQLQTAIIEKLRNEFQFDIIEKTSLVSAIKLRKI